MSDNNEQEALFHKIRSLLRKAESTIFEEEANSFIQKAQELMLRYSIDEEELWSKDPERRAKVETIEFKIADKVPGAQYKRIILNNIARLNNSRMWYVEQGNVSLVAGYPSDLAWIDMLFTSIMTQASFKMAMSQAIANTNVRTFRTNFWRGYSERVIVRLEEAYKAAQTNVKSTTGSTDLVLLDRKSKVDAFVKQELRLRLKSSSYRDSSKHDAGARALGNHAAENTDISGGRGSLNKQRGQLNA